jgi:hypothetical protein
MRFISKVLVVILFLTFGVAEAQLRPSTQPQGEKKGLFIKPAKKPQELKNFFMQLELGSTSRSYSIEEKYLGQTFKGNFSSDASLAFINFSLLPVIQRVPVSSDSLQLIEVRARATTGLWDFYDHEFSDVFRIPLIAGGEVAYSYKINNDITILPYLGLGLGMSIFIGDTSYKKLSMLYNIRVGTDMQIMGGMRAGIALVFNRIKDKYNNNAFDVVRHNRYNQFVFTISM